jgi:hypothetical protein
MSDGRSTQPSPGLTMAPSGGTASGLIPGGEDLKVSG